MSEYTELAYATEKWMRQIKAVWIDTGDKSGEIPHHITVEEWAIEFGYSVNEDTGEATESTEREWQHVKLEMIMLGIPIAVHDFRGHYIGQPGDQASNVVLNVQHALARLERAILHLEAVKTSGEWDNCRKQMKGKLIPKKLKLLLDNTPGVVPERYYGVPSDDLKLLMSGGQQDLEM